MTYSQFKKDIDRLKKVCLDIDKTYEDCKKVFGDYCFESPWYSAVYRCFELAVDVISQKYEDETTQWISWYIWENDWGKNAMEAGYDGDMKPIKTTRDLWKVLTERREKDED